ncbi:MAG TPA: undecaprenyldiphospho-muramoylpentapeptide beta-N-acetylglucosaminyltransferase [Clostridiales bacterium]|nr:undecaprenyldiphospho-muramoylpentapeptide beta-N-acetylglucosaminyltransferase [Clostridiales bacterium]
MRVLMTGGGTGGHVNPAIAIADTIKEHIPSAEIAFVGTKRGIENKLVPAAGYKLYHVDVRGFRRSLSLANIRAAFLAAVSPIVAIKLVKEFKPDVVIGTGGYVSWPLLVAASKLGVPSAVHESNAVPGLAVRRLVPYVDKIFVNFAVTGETLGAPEKTMHVGSPLRTDFGTVTRREAREKLGLPDSCRQYVVSFGGSLGAERVNSAVLDLMRDYLSKHPDIYCTHACGASGYEETHRQFEEAGLDKAANLELVEYIYDMPLRMAAADMVISRSGAITLSELAAAQKAAVLIPSPNVTDNQQYKNAKVFADAGGAVLIEEKDLTPERICSEVSAVLENPARMHRLEKNISAFAVPDSNERIYREIISLADGKKAEK